MWVRFSAAYNTVILADGVGGDWELRRGEVGVRGATTKRERDGSDWRRRAGAVGQGGWGRGGQWRRWRCCGKAGEDTRLGEAETAQRQGDFKGGPGGVGVHQRHYHHLPEHLPGPAHCSDCVFVWLVLCESGFFYSAGLLDAAFHYLCRFCSEIGCPTATFNLNTHVELYSERETLKFHSLSF
jgi:hypothetical protein